MSIKISNKTRSNWKFKYVFDSAGTPKLKYTRAQEKELVIERKWDEKREIITFTQAYTELSGWLGKSFANCSDLGFSDALFEIFTSGAMIHTPKADYRLWNPRKHAREATNSRKVVQC